MGVCAYFRLLLLLFWMRANRYLLWIAFCGGTSLFAPEPASRAVSAHLAKRRRLNSIVPTVDELRGESGGNSGSGDSGSGSAGDTSSIGSSGSGSRGDGSGGGASDSASPAPLAADATGAAAAAAGAGAAAATAAATASAGSVDSAVSVEGTVV